MRALIRVIVAVLVASNVNAAVPAWGQCGGNGYNGETTCVAGYVCTAVSPPYYSQCLPGSTPAPTSTTPSTPSTSSQPSTTSTPSSVRTILLGGYGTTISTLQFNPSANTVTVVGSCNAGNSPSWLTLNPANKNILYSTNEVTTGGISSFTINSSGICSEMASATSGGDGPAFMAAINNGSDVIALNYNSGNGMSYALSTDRLQFTNPVTIPKFPASTSHPHMVAQYGAEILIPDLGADKIWRLSRSRNSWPIAGYIPQPTGSGPRHIQIRGSTVFVLHELANTLSSQSIPSSPNANASAVLSSLSIVPSDVTNNYSGRFHAGELMISPDGAYLYASNRDTATPPDSRGDSIAIFSVDSSNKLTLVKQVFTGLQILRGVALSPDGAYIVAGGQNAGGVAVFERIDGGADLRLVATNPGAPASSSFVWL